MKPVNEMRVQFPSRSINERLARSVVSSFAAGLDPTLDELADLRTAVSEAVTNCIVHAYPDCIGKIGLQMRMYANGRLSVKISDWGVGIPDVQQAMTPLYTTGGEDRAGLGFSVMESFCDKVRVRSKAGSGTVVTLDKYIRSRVTEEV